MKGFDRTYCIGRLTADPVRKATPNGRELAEFTVAVDRGFGERKTTVFYRCTVWANNTEKSPADTVLKLFHKGDWIAVDGQVSASAYKGQDGTPKASLNLTVDNFLFMKPKATMTEEQFQAVQDEDNPF